MRRGAGRPLAGIRSTAVILGATLLSYQIVRTASVTERRNQPALAAALWPSHPEVLTDQAMVAVTTAGTANQPVPRNTRTALRQVATNAPLSPDPFLVEAAIAETGGRGALSEVLLHEARARDPRSRGTRFLLADHYFRTGRIAAGLVEMHVLVHLGQGGQPFVSALIAFARTPGAIPQLKAYFAAKPQLEASILSTLASDPRNADLVLSLASNIRNPNPDWRGTLVSALATAGEYRRAQAVWSRLTGVSPADGLYNPGFVNRPAPPPFNWAFPESGDGLAEPDGKGGLEILYYGRQRAVLASQLLLLKPGTYRLAAAVQGAVSESAGLAWALTCAKDARPLGEVPVRAGALAGFVTVPPDCEAQRIELVGIPGDRSERAQVTVRDLRLRAGANR